ncbi:hypothetical protein FRB91_006820 [Serendipita sp. 411]|nr:hypothetical protein FRB91_006820 [Serendipita sp. 411]
MPPKPTPNATLEGPLRDLNLQIPIETLDIRLMDSHEYQRKLDDGLVDQILETFHANAGPYQEHTTTYVHVAHNPKDPSRYVILDGRHRIEAARKFNRLSHSYKILTWRAFIHPAKRLIDPLLDQWISGWNAPHKGMLRTSAELLERMMKWDDVNIERCQQLLQLNPKHVGYTNRLYKKGTYKSLRNFIVQGSVFETISLRQMASVLTKEGDFAEWFTPLLIMDVTCQQSRLHNIPEIRHKIHHLLKDGADVTSLYNTISELDPKLAPEETFCKWETSFLDLDSSSDWVFGRKLFGLKDLSNMDILFSDWQNRVEFVSVSKYHMHTSQKNIAALHLQPVCRWEELRHGAWLLGQGTPTTQDTKCHNDRGGMDKGTCLGSIYISSSHSPITGIEISCHQPWATDSP